jgi:tetratricopeptide (TPR) repeat protein
MPMNAGGPGYWRHKAQAIVLLVFGRHAAAEAVFDTMLQLWPGDAYALTSRAHLRAQRGARSEAIADYRSLVAAHPKRAAADWFNLAFLLESVDRLDDAEAAFREAVALGPALDRAWYGLGLVLIRQQRFDEAVAALRRNTELQPMSPYGWYQLARVHVDRKDLDEALRIIRHLKGFEPKIAAQLERETGLAA